MQMNTKYYSGHAKILLKTIIKRAEVLKSLHVKKYLIIFLINKVNLQPKVLLSSNQTFIDPNNSTGISLQNSNCKLQPLQVQTIASLELVNKDNRSALFEKKKQNKQNTTNRQRPYYKKWNVVLIEMKNDLKKHCDEKLAIDREKLEIKKNNRR